MRSILFLVFCCLSSLLSAQYEKGNWYLDVGSSINYSPQASEFGSVRNVRLKGGFFVKENLLLGAEVRNDNFDGQGLSDGYGLSLFARYYLPNRNGARLRFYGETVVNVGLGDVPDFDLGIGAEYALTPNVLISSHLSGGFAGRRGLIGTFRMGTNYVFGASNREQYVTDFFHRKGDLMLDANFGSLATNGRFYNSGNFNLAGGYFLSNHLMITGELRYGRSSYDLGTDAAPRTLDITTFTAGVGFRYQFSNGKRLQPYLAAGVQYVREAADQVNWSSGIEQQFPNSSSLKANLGAGLLYHLNNNIALDFNVGVRPNLWKTSDAKSGRFAGSLGFKVFLDKR